MKLRALLLAISFLAQPVWAADLSPQSERLAKELKVMNLIERIHDLQKRENPPTSTAAAVELLSLLQKLDYRLTVAGLQIEDAISACDQEDTRADEMRFVLESKRDKALKLNSLANIVGSGVLASLGASLGIHSDITGNIVSTAAGGVNAGIAGIAYKEQTEEGGALRHYEPHPNMLAMIFGFTPDDDSKMPDIVWNYLNEPESLDATQTRREALIKSWVKLGRIPPLETPKGKAECALIAGTVAGSHTLTVSILDDRSAMLADLRVAISKMKRNLLELMLALTPEQ